MMDEYEMQEAQKLAHAEARQALYSDPRHHMRVLVGIYGQLLAIPFEDPWRIKHQALYAAVARALAEDTGVPTEHVQNFCSAIGSYNSMNYGQAIGGGLGHL